MLTPAGRDDARPDDEGAGLADGRGAAVLADQLGAARDQHLAAVETAHVAADHGPDSAREIGVDGGLEHRAGSRSPAGSTRPRSRIWVARAVSADELVTRAAKRSSGFNLASSPVRGGGRGGLRQFLGGAAPALASLRSTTTAGARQWDFGRVLRRGLRRGGRGWGGLRRRSRLRLGLGEGHVGGRGPLDGARSAAARAARRGPRDRC